MDTVWNSVLLFSHWIKKIVNEVETAQMKCIKVWIGLIVPVVYFWFSLCYKSKLFAMEKQTVLVWLIWRHLTLLHLYKEHKGLLQQSPWCNQLFIRGFSFVQRLQWDILLLREWRHKCEARQPKGSSCFQFRQQKNQQEPVQRLHFVLCDIARACSIETII